MDFISATFIIFVIILAGVYFITPKKAKWVILLLGSYVFYMASGVKMLFFLLLTTVVTFVSGLILGNINEKQKLYLKEHKEELTREQKKKLKSRVLRKKKWIVAFAVVINLGLLIFLKYFNFIGGNLNSLLAYLGIEGQIPHLSLLLPLGISFYTLQSIAYIVDLYRGKYQADRNIFKFSLFMSFFPQIVQGPIARYDHLAHQLYEPHKFDYDRVTQGVQLILWGFMKKMVLADRIAIPVNMVFAHPNKYHGFILFFAAAGYGLQVYGDFSGGMDIARGVAQILGIDLAVNFERPYFATSIEEFWRRWHITLGGWMRDYIFYPLSLSKAFASLGKGTRKVFGNYIGKKLPAFLSMFIVFLLVGVWHGSEWKYVAYGVWNGTIIVSSILLDSFYEKFLKKCKVNTECFSWKFFQMARTFVLCSFGRFFPRAGSCTTAVNMIKGTVTHPNPWVFFDGSFLELGLDYKDFYIIFAFLIVLLVVGIMQERGIRIREKIAEQNLYFRWILYIGAVIVLLIYGSYGPGYATGEFIYQQF